MRVLPPGDESGENAERVKGLPGRMTGAGASAQWKRWLSVSGAASAEERR